jgi:hypothetical protein
MALGTLYHFKLRRWPRFSREPSISVEVKVLSLPLSHSTKVNGGNKNVQVVQYLLQEIILHFGGVTSFEPMGLVLRSKYCTLK